MDSRRHPQAIIGCHLTSTEISVLAWWIDGGARNKRGIVPYLEHVVLALFYRDRDRFIEVKRHAIALNASFFKTRRMVQQYMLNAYFH